MLLKTMLLLFVAILSTTCHGQQTQQSKSVTTNSNLGDKQIRLEDIEQDVLNKISPNQQPRQQNVQQTQSNQQQLQAQQQLAAYHQQLLLQQLQSPYFAPHAISYPSYNAVPLMIIPGNHLGVGSPAPLPLQAYFFPDPSYIYQQQPPLQHNTPTVAASNSIYQVPTTQQLQPATRYQPLISNQLYRLPQTSQTHQQQQQQQQPLTNQQIQQQPLHHFTYTSTLPQQSQYFLPSSQSQSASAVQPAYNAYNAIYQQRQQKYTSGIKSTPAPSNIIKSASQSVSQNPIATYSQSQLHGNDQSSSYVNYKSF